jgi:acetyltransferase-like isoleucine patch superfamily enzyme
MTQLEIGTYLSPTAQLDPAVRLPDHCYIGLDAQVGPHVTLSPGCSIGNRTRLLGPIHLARNVSIGPGCILLGPLDLGENVRIGRSVRIGGTRAPGAPDDAPTTLAAGVRIGRSSTILAGLALGPHAVLLPDSALEGDLYEYCQAGGEPARLLGVVCPTCGRPAQILSADGPQQTYHCPVHINHHIQSTSDIRLHAGHILLPGSQFGPYLPLVNTPRRFSMDFDL